MSPTNHDFTGRVLSSRYYLDSLLGTGAFASVYLARDRKTYDREVAVKVLHPQHTRNQDYVERFRQEIRVAAKIATRHREHLVQIVDQGCCDGQSPTLVYFVMEYIDGLSLRALVSGTRNGARVQRPLAWQRAVALAQQLCRAIAPLHAHGVIHRDIKPENCLIERRSDRECIKLLDLGIAKVAPDGGVVGQGPTTDVRLVLGTPRYMAPEQMYGQDVDRRADIYAVGVILYEFLTGTMPRRIHFADLEVGIIPPEPAPPSQLAPDSAIPPALDAAVLQAIAWRREDRFSRAEALAAALEDASRTAPTRTRGITSRITQPFLSQVPTRRVAAASPPPSPPIAVLPEPVAPPPSETVVAFPSPSTVAARRWIWASRRLGWVMVAASTVSGLVFALGMMVTMRSAHMRAVPRPVLDEFNFEAARPVAAVQPLVVTAPRLQDGPEAGSPDDGDGREAPTAARLVKRAEPQIRAHCGITGETREVEYVVDLAAGSAAVRAVTLPGAWSGPEHAEFRTCVAERLARVPFANAVDRPADVRGVLRL